MAFSPTEAECPSRLWCFCRVFSFESLGSSGRGRSVLPPPTAPSTAAATGRKRIRLPRKGSSSGFLGPLSPQENVLAAGPPLLGPRTRGVPCSLRVYVASWSAAGGVGSVLGSRMGPLSPPHDRTMYSMCNAYEDTVKIRRMHITFPKSLHLTLEPLGPCWRFP